MVPSGPSTPIGGTQSVPASHLRSNSSLMGGGAQPNSIQSQPPFSSLVSPRTQFNSTNNLLANISNVSSLLNHSFQNGGSNVSVSSMLGNAGIDPMNPNGNQLGLDHRQNQQLDPVSNFQQQFQVQQQRGGMGPVKLEQHQLQSMRSLGPVKMEPQHSDTSIFLQQQQHQQQLVQLSRQSSQAAAAAQMNLLQQQQQQQLQRILKQQQQQQQQQLILKSLPQQRGQLQQQHLHQQSVPVRTPQAKPAAYEPGTCARRLTHYMYHQKHKPADNNIEFWRKFVAEYFAPNAKKRWCVSLYGNGRQTTGVFPQDIWHCEICNRKPGRGFETTVEVLPRLCQIKYASGTLEELLYVDMPREYQNASGQIVLDYAKAIQESVFELLRVVRDGQLRIVFNQDLKIASWEFCARRHEELIPRRLIIPQISQLGAVVHKYQAAAQNSPSSLSTQDLQNTCSSFVSSARQLAKALEVPLVNDLGYTKRYVRCLQISEVVNSMKDLIDYSRETGTGPMDSLINFSRRSSSSSSWAQHKQPQQPEEHQQQSIYHNSNQNSPGSAPATNTQLVSISNAITSINNSVNAPSSSTSSTVTMAALLHQNSMNSQHDNQMGPTNIQIPSASSSNAVPSPTPSLSNNNLNTNESDPNDSQSSVQQILQEMLMSSQLNEMKGPNGSNFLGFGNGISNSMGGFGAIGGISPSAATSGMRVAMAMNHMSRDPVVLNHQQQQQSMGNRMLGGLGAVNNFSNLHFDWKLP